MNKNAEAPPRPAVTFAGREYRLVEWPRHNVLHHVHLMALSKAAGLAGTLPEPEETPAEYFLRLQIRLMESGRMIDLVAAYLLPPGMDEADWTPAVAAEIAEHIGRCTAEEDFSTVMRLATGAAEGFFRSGLDSSGRFPTSSAPAPSTSPPAPPPTVH